MLGFKSLAFSLSQKRPNPPAALGAPNEFKDGRTPDEMNGQKYVMAQTQALWDKAVRLRAVAIPTMQAYESAMIEYNKAHVAAWKAWDTAPERAAHVAVCDAEFEAQYGETR